MRISQGKGNTKYMIYSLTSLNVFLIYIFSAFLQMFAIFDNLHRFLLNFLNATALLLCVVANIIGQTIIYIRTPMSAKVQSCEHIATYKYYRHIVYVAPLCLMTRQTFIYCV